MSGRFIKIVAFGLIGDDEHKGPYRQVVFEDTEGDANAEMIIYKKERPGIWADIEKMERGGNIAPYKGFIARYNALDVVVFGGESLEEAFVRQKWKLNIKGKISYIEAEQMRKESVGYQTNLTFGNALEIGWRPLSTEALLVKFRFREKKSHFFWTNWYEIVKNS